MASRPLVGTRALCLRSQRELGVQRFLTLQPFVLERGLRIFSPLGGRVFVAFAPRYRTSVSARCTGGGAGVTLGGAAADQRPCG